MSESNAPFLEHSQRFWQDRTDRPLSDEDVRQITENLTGLFRVLAEWAAAEEHHEKIHRAGITDGGLG